jgi:sec-independent protein translocase protein TatA
MFNIGPWELLLILFIALIVFGPGKLPEVAKGMGKAVKEFKQASTGIQKQFEEAIKTDVPETPVVSTNQSEVPIEKVQENNTTEK